MLDSWTFKNHVLTHTGLVYSVCKRVGFRGEELHDAVRDCWAAVWTDREKWPPGGPENEVAFLRTVALRTAQDRMRMLKDTKKRGKGFETLSMHRADNRDFADTSDGAGFRVFVDYEGSFDRALIEHAIRVVAATLSMESEAIIVARLDDGPSFGKHVTQKAFRNFRRALELPADAPYKAGVKDPADHLIRTAQRIEREAQDNLDDVELTQENPCAIDNIQTRSRERPLTNDVPQRSGARVPSLTASPSSDLARASPSSRACERTPSSRSRLLLSVSARSRRQAPSVSPRTAATLASRPLRQPERTAVTRMPEWLEDSSVSGSRG